MQNFKSFISAALLITGTSVGAGMLGIPLVTSIAGFYPSLLITFLCWLVMMATGLLFLEVTLWMPKGANLLSMAKRFLGPVGASLSGFTFLFLYYCLMIAYMAGGSPLFQSVISNVFGLQIPLWASYVLFCGLFGGIVYGGSLVLGRLNTILTVALVASYFLLISKGSAFVIVENLQRASWPLFYMAAPVLFSAFGYHNIVPTISDYLKRNAKALRWCIFVGTLIPFIIYSLWQWLIIGAVPAELIEAAEKGNIPVTDILSRSLHNDWIGQVAQFFSFFALVTSLLGVAYSMCDFLADGFKCSKNRLNWLLITLLVFIPPAYVAFSNPTIFVSALGYAGGFGEAILNGLLPISMYWIGRYRFNLGNKIWIGNRAILVLLTFMILAVIGIEVAMMV
ncbi:MAG: tyrosine transporter [Parachlamydiales bacterium]|nr:tyrosine transporter [Parachlamydiales bacterium]